MRARATWPLALVVALLAPCVAADHVYSHRVIVQGRLVDAVGLPIPGREVRVSFAHDDDPTGACTAEQQNVTDAWGDFWFCYHKHSLRPDIQVTVASGGASETRGVDPQLRTDLFLLQDNASLDGVAPPGWNETFRVDGRVWHRGVMALEGVIVKGNVVPGASVQVTLEGARGRGSTYDLDTDAFGDYDETLRLVDGEDARNVILLVATQGATLEGKLDTLHHRNVVDFRLPFGDAAAPAAVGDEPGSRTPRASVTLVLLTIVGATASFAWVARRR